MNLNLCGTDALLSVATEGGRASSPNLLAVHMDGPYTYQAAGCEFRVTTPDEDRDLWEQYLSGALANYRRFGVEKVLEYDSVISGHSTSRFFAAVDPGGAVLGGMRVQGPYSSAEQAHALAEWDGRAGTDELRREIDARIDHGGVIEMKTGWVAPHAPRKRELTAALARVFLHAIRLERVRYALGTVATHAVPRWTTTGGRISADVTPVAYPDARYRTVPMWWDGEREMPEGLEAKMNDEHDRLLWSAASPAASDAAA